MIRHILYATSAIVCMAAAPAAAQVKSFDIPAQPANSGIAALGRQADVQIGVARKDSRGKRTNAVRGQMDVEQALGQLLKGTGLTAKATGAQTYTVLPLAGGARRAPPSPVTARSETASARPAMQDEAESETGQDIVVTARKREERSLDVPIALTAFSGEALEDRNARSLVDVLQEAPGVGIVDLGGGVTQTSIRGVAPVFGANANGFYLDELPFTGVTVAVEPDVRAWDLDRVEILRGPQGTLFGEGSMGGTVRVLTRDADLDDWGAKGEGSISSTKGGGENEALKGAANLPIVPGMLAVRVAGTYEDIDGWIDDPANDQTNVNNQRVTTLRTKVRFQPSSRLTLNGSFWLYDNRSHGGLSSTDEGNVSAVNRPTLSDIKYRLYGLTARYDLDGVSLFASTSFNNFNSDKQSIYYGGDYTYAIDIDVNANELRLASNGDGPFTWTTGIYRRTAERHDDYALEAFGLSGTENARSATTALYGEGTYSIAGSLDLTAGLRYFHDSIRTAPSSSSTGANEATATFEHLSPRFIISWRPDTDISLYASAANGFRSGQAQFSSSLAVAETLGIDLPEKTSPDSIWTYEVGTKARLLDGRLILEGALYYSRWKDVPVIIPLGVTGLTGLLNSEGTNMRGAEISAVAKLARGLSINASLGYVDAEYAGDVPGSAIKKGDRFLQIPKFTGSAAINYRRPIDDGLAAVFNLSGQYGSRRPNDARNLPGDPISRVDGQIGIEGKNWGLFLFAENLLNDDGVIRQRFVTNLGAGVQDIVGERLQPRTIGLRLRLETGRP